MSDYKIRILNINKINNNHIELIKDLYPKRYSVALKFRFHDDFLRSIGSTLLIYKAFPSVNENEINYSDLGKPIIQNKYFNISHSGDYVVFIESNNDIGIDIEKNEENRILNMKKFLPEFKDKDLSEKTMLKIWTSKEAILKNTGIGISDFKNISVTENDIDKAIEYKNLKYFIRSIEYENYIISFAALSQIDDVSIVEINY